MYRIVIVLSAALLILGTSTVSFDAKADTVISIQASGDRPKPRTQRTLGENSAAIFWINGKRVFVPADENADAVIAALKRRYPNLTSDSGSSGMATAIK